jgi:MFS family permease
MPKGEEELLVASARRHPRDVAKNLNLLALFFNASVTYLISPYFSAYASHQLGMPTSWIGLVFASLSLGYLVSSIAMSFANISHLRLFTVNRIMRVAMLVIAAMSIVFGLLPDITSAAPLAGATYGVIFAALRFMQGVAFCVLDVAVLMYCTKLFPGRVSKIVGENEAVMGLGVVFAPPIGGALFEVGGFRLPQLVIAAASIAVCLAALLYAEMDPGLKELHSFSVVPPEMLPIEPSESYTSEDFAPKEDDKDDGANGEGPPLATSQNIRRVLLLPLFVAIGPMCTNMLSSASLGLCEAISPLYFAERYGISALQYGFILGATAFCYAAAAVLSGDAMGGANKPLRPLFISASLLVMAVFMFLVGSKYTILGLQEPSNHVEKGISILAAIVVGLPLAALQVVGVSICVDWAKKQDRAMVPAAAALVNFGASLGGFLGPTVGGRLVELRGFGDTYFVFSVACIAVAAMYYGSYACSKSR